MSVLPTQHIAAVVLARGGSKSIPLKNIRPILGLPMLEWNINAVHDFGKFDSVWISTDDDAIASVATSLKTQVHRRSKEVSFDDTSSIESLLEFLQYHNEIGIAALIQCTTPFLHPKYLHIAYSMILDEGYDSVFSVTRKKSLRWKEVSEGESTKPMNFNPENRPRRQDWDGELIENGVFYFAKRFLLESKRFQGGRCGYVEMPNECSVDINNEWDCLYAENLLPTFGYHSAQCKCKKCARE